MDFVQFRWQQIRTFEHLQRLERENVTLRSQLRMNSSNLIQVQEKNEILTNQLQESYQQIKNCGRELKSMRSYTEQSLFAMKDFYRIKIEEMVKYIGNYDQKLKQKVTDESLTANNDLQKELENALLTHETNLKTKNNEIEKLKNKIGKLQNEIQESEKSRTNILRDCQTYKNNYEEEKKNRMTTETKIETLSAEIKVLKSQANKSEVEAQQREQSWHFQMKSSTSQYEQTILGLSKENDQLRHMIRELQEQLNKIMNEFMGSKSHFAKFVELKSENMMLQSKLTNMTRKVLGSSNSTTPTHASESRRNVPTMASNPRSGLPSPVANDMNPEETVKNRILRRMQPSTASYETNPSGLINQATNSKMYPYRPDRGHAIELSHSERISRDTGLQVIAPSSDRLKEMKSESHIALDSSTEQLVLGVPLLNKSTRKSLQVRHVDGNTVTV